MIPRKAKAAVQSALKQFPAVALIGPRQVGKTTLAKEFQGRYFDLEQESERLRLDGHWNTVVSHSQLVILDEAQREPKLFPRLRGAIDENRKKKGRFLLLGSISPELMRNVSESLAGRIGYCELTPIGCRELPPRVSLDSLWLHGGYPDGGLLKPGDFPKWEEAYLYSLAHRDLPMWGLRALPSVTERLFRMLSHGHGQLWNASQIGQSMGLSYHTIQSYAETLQSSFLIRFLPPFHGNPRQRLLKSPKLYWRDTGLLHSLWGVRDLDDLQSRPLMGASWEGWMIEQVLIYLQEAQARYEASFLRTKEGLEVDLILEIGQDRWAIEIKFTSEPTADDVRTLEKAAALAGANRLAILCRTGTSYSTGRTHIVSLNDFLNLLAPRKKP